MKKGGETNSNETHQIVELINCCFLLILQLFLLVLHECDTCSLRQLQVFLVFFIEATDFGLDEHLVLALLRGREFRCARAGAARVQAAVSQRKDRLRPRQ